MDRVEYNACVGAGMKGKQLDKEQRKLEFCIVAKTCSGKAKSRDEAMAMCKESASQPKPPKVKKAASCEDAVLRLARCVADNINMDQASNINSIEMALANAMMVCQCHSKGGD